MNEPRLLSVLFATALAIAGLRRVPAHRVMTVRRLGRYRRTLGPGWHWIVPGLERAGLEVDLIGHHLHVRGGGAGDAELYYQITEPEKAGETLDEVDAWVAAQAREVMDLAGNCPDRVKAELNRRVGLLGLRVVRCDLRAA